jgi:NaMN:DMB phosphoribosyltransferase
MEGVGVEREGVEWVVREGVGVGGEMIQALYAHMNNKKIKIKKKKCAIIS